MSETWYRGEAAGGPSSRPGGSLHDFGDGLYFSNSEDVAWQYAKTRTPNHAQYRIWEVSVDRGSLGRVLDLTADARWDAFMKESIFPGHPEPRLNFVLRQNEIYGQFFEEFAKRHGIDISSLDAVIGPEYVRGGKQLCILNKNGAPSPIAQRVRAMMSPEEWSSQLTKTSGGAAPGSEPPPPTTPPVVEPPGVPAARLAKIKAGIKAGLKDAFHPANLAEGFAAEIPFIILHFADKAARRDALRNIQVKFIKEGFAKGVAAGIMAWTEEEVRLNLSNGVTAFRVQGMGDAAGSLKLSDMLKLAQAFETYATQVGYWYASEKPMAWRKQMQSKGFALLKKHNYEFSADPQILFEADFILKLAFVLGPTTNLIVGPAIKFK